MTEEMVDLVFALSGRAVAADYADLLWRALCAALPWLATEPAVAVLPLARVSPGDGQIYLSKYSRLTLRLPAAKAEAARALCGMRLELPGPVEVGAAKLRSLQPAKVVYSPLVVVGTADEPDFVAECRRQLKALGIEGQQPIVGKAQTLQAGERRLAGFSLMLHGLNAEDSLRLQRAGLGGEHQRGCGIFVQHKSVAAVGGEL